MDADLTVRALLLFTGEEPLSFASPGSGRRDKTMPPGAPLPAIHHTLI